MRRITHIVIHCTATPAGREVSVKEIDRWHRARGFAKIGYHYVIHLDGTVSVGRPEREAGAHVSGWNATTIGVSYVGGVSADDHDLARDTRTPAQKEAMEKLVRELVGRYPGAEVLGHRDFPGVAKACPSFDARKWWASVKDNEAPAKEPARMTYKVRSGETLFRIARNNGMSVDEVVALNPGLDPDKLQVGQTIYLS